MKMQCEQRPIESVNPALFKRSGALAIAAVVAIGGLVLGSGTVWASSFSWSPAQNMSADTDVVTSGKLVHAYALGNGTSGSTTINGVTFVNSSDAGAGFDALGSETDGGTGARSPPSPLCRRTIRHCWIMALPGRGRPWEDHYAHADRSEGWRLVRIRVVGKFLGLVCFYPGPRGSRHGRKRNNHAR